MMSNEEIEFWLGERNGSRRNILLVMCESTDTENTITEVFERYFVNLTIEPCISSGLGSLSHKDKYYHLIVTSVALPRTNAYYKTKLGLCEKGGIEMVQEWCRLCRNSGYTNQIPVLYLATSEAKKYRGDGTSAAGVNNSAWLVSPTVDQLRRAAATRISQTQVGRRWP